MFCTELKLKLPVTSICENIDLTSEFSVKIAARCYEGTIIEDNWISHGCTLPSACHLYSSLEYQLDVVFAWRWVIHLQMWTKLEAVQLKIEITPCFPGNLVKRMQLIQISAARLVTRTQKNEHIRSFAHYIGSLLSSVLYTKFWFLHSKDCIDYPPPISPTWLLSIHLTTLVVAPEKRVLHWESASYSLFGGWISMEDVRSLWLHRAYGTRSPSYPWQRRGKYSMFWRAEARLGNVPCAGRM